MSKRPSTSGTSGSNSARSRSPRKRQKREVAMEEGFLKNVASGNFIKSFAAFCGRSGRRRNSGPVQPGYEPLTPGPITQPEGLTISTPLFISISPSCSEVEIHQGTVSSTFSRDVNINDRIFGTYKALSHEAATLSDKMDNTEGFPPRANDDKDSIEGTSPTQDSKETESIELVDNSVISVTPPLNSRYPEIFTYRGNEGHFCSALSLTKNMIWQWNTIFRCEAKIAEYMERIESANSQQEELQEMIDELNEQAQLALDNHQDPADEYQSLEEAGEIERGLGSMKARLEEKLEHTRKELRLPRSQLFGAWRGLLAENNLLEPLPERSANGASIDNHQAVAQEEILPKAVTESEAGQLVLLDAKDAAIEEMHQKEHHLQNAADKVDNWKDYYNAELREYNACVQQGIVETTRSMFDGILLQQQRTATAELTQAEAEFENALNEVRRLGIVWNGSTQESGFRDYPDDGYRESMEAAWVEHVDRSSIERWMENHEGDQPFHPPECDEWDSKTVDLSDSVSCVAGGKEKKRILRWREMTRMHNVNEDDSGETSQTQRWVMCHSPDFRHR